MRQEELLKALMLRRERARLTVHLTTPPHIVEAEQGAGAVVRKTVTGSLIGLTWSVGCSSSEWRISPWAILFWLGRKLWRARKNRTA